MKYKMHLLTMALAMVGVMSAFSSHAKAQQNEWSQSSAPVTTGSTHEAVGLAEQQASTFVRNLLNSTNRPAWLTRTDVTYDIQQNATPVTGVETIQPLFMDISNTLFWQGRAGYNSGSMTYNLGLGYRYLTADKLKMFGVNVFFDENIRFQHKRLGIGAEYFMPYVTIRANYYDALTGQRYVGGGMYERALDGFDLGIETPVPNVSWMRFTAKGYHWAGVKTSNVNGGLMNLRMFPARQLEADAGLAYDNSQNTQAFLTLNYYLGSPAFIEYSASTPHPEGLWAAQNLENMRLQKVIRTNSIVVEKTNPGVGGAAVIIARGN